MANYQNNGGRNVAVPDESRQSWRPQDQDASGHRYRGNEDDHNYRGWRDRHHNDHMEHDPRRWEGSRGSEVGSWQDRGMGDTERYGQGQSGYSAGRYGDDRSQRLQMQNRNEMRPSPGSFEERNYELGTDDRFRGANAWSDRDRSSARSDRYAGDPRGYARQSGYSADRGFSQNGYGGQGYDARTQHMGYQSSAARGDSDWSPSQRPHDGHDNHDTFGRGNEAPQHMRGAGPHRGKGPQGYQRSDERIHELVCEALADDDMIDASQIQVTVKDGEVTLSGVVDSRRIKREAEDCVASIAGVRDVQLQLRVRDEQDRSMRTGMGQSSHGQQQASGANPSTSAGTPNASTHLGNGIANGKTESDASHQDKKHRA